MFLHLHELHISIIITFQLCSAVAEQFRILVITPAGSQLVNSHFEFHKQLASEFAKNKHVEKVLLLGLVESSEKNETILPSATGLPKLTIWKRNRRAEKIGQVPYQFTLDPLKNAWRKRVDFMPKENEGVKKYNLEFLLNEELMSDLRKWKFNLGCIESIGLNGLQQGILHFLGIQSQCHTATVAPPSMSHWHLMGYQKIVENIPGLNLAEIGDHKKVLVSNGKAFYDKNMMWIERKEKSGQKTYEEWIETINLLGDSEESQRLKSSLQTFPKMEELFTEARFFFVNSQLALDYKFVEKEVQERGNIVESAMTNKGKGHLSMQMQNFPRLLYVGGMGLLNHVGAKVEKKLDGMTEAIFALKRPIILVSFGSVVEFGFVEPHWGEQLKRDTIAKEKAFLSVFKKFDGASAEFEHFEFIMKFGKSKGKNYEKIGENVHTKGWVDQKAILAKGPSKMRAFISHCGIHSVLEAVNFGIPLICIPFFGDQLNNSEALASRGVAIVVDFEPYDKIVNGKVVEQKDADQKFMEELEAALKNIGNLKANMEQLREEFIKMDPAKTIHEQLEWLHKQIGKEH